jgi:hypothetical protein
MTTENSKEKFNMDAIVDMRGKMTSGAAAKWNYLYFGPERANGSGGLLLLSSLHCTGNCRTQE